MKARKEYVIFIFCLVTTMILAGCSTEKNIDIPKSDGVKAVTTVPKLNTTEDVMKEIASTVGVLNTQLSSDNKSINVVITLGEYTNKENVQEMAQKWVNLVKQANKDKKVNIKILQNGKVIANAVL